MRITELLSKAAELGLSIDQRHKEMLLYAIAKFPAIDQVVELTWQRKDAWIKEADEKGDKSITLFWSGQRLIHWNDQGQCALERDLLYPDVHVCDPQKKAEYPFDYRTGREWLAKGLFHCFRVQLILDGHLPEQGEEAGPTTQEGFIEYVYRGKVYSLCHWIDTWDPHESPETIALSWLPSDLLQSLLFFLAPAQTGLQTMMFACYSERVQLVRPLALTWANIVRREFKNISAGFNVALVSSGRE